MTPKCSGLRTHRTFRRHGEQALCRAGAQPSAFKGCRNSIQRQPAKAHQISKSPQPGANPLHTSFAKTPTARTGPNQIATSLWR
ncbi:dipeptide/oligopeptide/nickel ABC transporter permease [Anopheles sinensis]|uniref:Dipeptide/oligopeptide/nickel ABC transporter permease n=1 Tax=Anopheles sinensis TaxID=74873 RepID=A0A084WE73_ANOSI|nr:dipeptide/oligopeptide/nickel ABC transporter permease [Anopheles sinensis]